MPRSSTSAVSWRSTRGAFAPPGRLLERALERDADDGDLLARIEASLAYVEAETGDRERGLRAVPIRRWRDPASTAQTRGIDPEPAGVAPDAARARPPRRWQRSRPPSEPCRDLPDDAGRAFLNRGNVYLQQGHAGARRVATSRARSTRLEAGRHGSRRPRPSTTSATPCSSPATWSAPCARWTAPTRRSGAAERRCCAAIGEQDRAEVLMAAGLVERGSQLLDARGAGLRVAAAAPAAGRGRARPGAEPRDARPVERARAAARRAARRFAAVGTSAMAGARGGGRARGRGRAGPDAARASLTRGDDLARASWTAQGLHWGARRGARCTRPGCSCAAASARRRAVGLARVRVDERAPLAVRLLARDVRAELAERRASRQRAPAATCASGCPTCTSGRARSAASTCRPTSSARGGGSASARWQLAVDSRKPEVLFEWSERARMLASRVQPVRAPQDESMVADLAELREIAQALRGRSAYRPRARGRAAAAGARARLAAPRAPARSTTRSTLGELQDALGADTALVAYVVTGNRVVALVVTDGAADPARPGRARAAGGACSAGCCPTSTWRPPTCRTRWPRPYAASWPPGSTDWPGCWWRRCWTRSATGGWC